MKKLMFIFGIIVLTLTSCTNKSVETTVSTTDSATVVFDTASVAVDTTSVVDTTKK